jgi:hypothetical protein
MRLAQEGIMSVKDDPWQGECHDRPLFWFLYLEVHVIDYIDMWLLD